MFHHPSRQRKVNTWDPGAAKTSDQKVLSQEEQVGEVAKLKLNGGGVSSKFVGFCGREHLENEDINWT